MKKTKIRLQMGRCPVQSRKAAGKGCLGKALLVRGARAKAISPGLWNSRVERRLRARTVLAVLQCAAVLSWLEEHPFFPPWPSCHLTLPRALRREPEQRFQSQRQREEEGEREDWGVQVRRQWERVGPHHAEQHAA